MRKFFIISLLCFAALPLCASEKISDAASKTIDEFMAFRMHLSACTTPNGALSQINAFEKNTAKKISSFNDEEQLILNNFIVLEKYNYMHELNADDPDLKKMMLAQHDKNDDWLAAHKNETPNKWLYCTSADVISCCMRYFSMSKIMKIGFVIKTNYEEALKQDAGLSYALTNLAQWYYYAPSFGGGSKTKAHSLFERALAGARTSAETYYAKIFLSQCLYEEKNLSLAQTMLAEAAKAMPESKYVAHLQRLNDAGYSLYYYNQHQDEVDKKLS